jgi:hypothetical protein
MQAMTHFAVGILGYSIYRSANSYLQKTNAKNITAVTPSDEPSFAVKVFKLLLLLLILFLLSLSHVLLDALAMATYHPSSALTGNTFWICFHAFVVLVTVFLLWKYKGAILFMLASVVPDADWIARPFGLWPEGAAHEYFRNLPGLSYLDSVIRSSVPDWRWEAFASLNELALFVCVMIFVSFFTTIPTVSKLN